MKEPDSDKSEKRSPQGPRRSSRDNLPDVDSVDVESPNTPESSSREPDWSSIEFKDQARTITSLMGSGSSAPRAPQYAGGQCPTVPDSMNISDSNEGSTLIGSSQAATPQDTQQREVPPVLA